MEYWNRFYNVIEYWNFLSSVAMLLINFEFWSFGSTISTRFWLERVAMFWILYRHAFCRLCKNHIWTDMWIYLGVFDSLVGRCLHGVVGKIMICTHVTWRLVNTCCPTRSAYLDQQLMIPICQSDITSSTDRGSRNSVSVRIHKRRGRRAHGDQGHRGVFNATVPSLCSRHLL
jgi:hypothetical protein